MTADEASNAAAMLKNMQAGFIPQVLFKQFARLVVLPSFVVVPLFCRNGVVFTRLTKRDANDPDYPDQWHPPGTVIRPTDASLQACFERLRQSELPSMTLIGSPTLYDIAFTQIVRGKELSLLHWVEIIDERTPDCFPIGELPGATIDTDIPRIQAAATHFAMAGRVRDI